MTHLKLGIVAALVLSLSGCTWFAKETKPVEVETRIQPIPVFHPPLPEPINWEQVEWRVLTPAQMKEYVEKVEAGDAPGVVYYAITTDTYESLSANMADIKRYLSQSRALLMYYRENLVEIVVEQTGATVEDKEQPQKEDE